MKASPEGVKVRYGHPDGSTGAILDSFLGRAKSPRLDGDKVRADLHLDPSAMLSANGGASAGQKVMTRAKSDPTSFGSSLAVKVEKNYRLDNRGHKKLDARGGVLPPIWEPLEIGASDIVDEGDAVHDGFLAASIEATEDATADDEELRIRWRHKQRKAAG